MSKGKPKKCTEQPMRIAGAATSLKGWAKMEREPITHDIKVWPEFFQAIKRGEKTFEYRKNDRDYQHGDTLHLMEYYPGTGTKGTLTGDYFDVKVTYILYGGSMGIPDDYCIMSIL